MPHDALTAANQPPTLTFYPQQVFSLSVVCLWMLCSARTIAASVSGSLFSAPCVAEYEKERIRKKLEKLESKTKRDTEPNLAADDKV